MNVVKYVLVDERGVIGSTFTPRALGILARDYPDATAMIRMGYAKPYSYTWLRLRYWANLEFLRAKESEKQ